MSELNLRFEPASIRYITCLGYLGCLGLVFVVNFPSTLMPVLHYIGAFLTMFGLPPYMLLLTRHLIQQNPNLAQTQSMFIRPKISVLERRKMAKFSCYAGIIFVASLVYLVTFMDKGDNLGVKRYNEDKDPKCYAYYSQMFPVHNSTHSGNWVEISYVIYDEYKYLKSLSAFFEWLSMAFAGQFMSSFSFEFQDLSVYSQVLKKIEEKQKLSKQNQQCQTEDLSIVQSQDKLEIDSDFLFSEFDSKILPPVYSDVV